MSVPKGAGFSQALEGSVICSNCPCQIVSSVRFTFGTDGKLDFQMELFKNMEEQEDQSAFVSETFTRTQQDDVTQKCTVECPHCSKTFVLSIHLTKTIKDGQVKIKFSVTTCENKNVETQTKDGEPRKNKEEKQNSSIPLCRTVKVFCRCTGEAFHGDDQVKKQLGKSSSLRVQESNLKDSDIVIVFCPITSRVGSDVESCMKDETVSSLKKPIILVLMHHTRDLDYSTAGTIWSEVYPNVVLDVHVLFHETKPGLLTCRQNQEAFEMIRNELMKYSKLSRISPANLFPSGTIHHI